MGEIKEMQTCHEMGFKENYKSHLWVLHDSLESSFSSEMIEDATSSSSSSSSSSSPLFKLSDLMEQLPIKRNSISKFYQGKSESFASLTSIKSIEDLAKKDKYPCGSRRLMKSYGQNQRLSQKATISKKKKGSSSSTTKTCIFSSFENMSSLIAN